MDMLQPLRREALGHPTLESFIMHYFSGYQGRYWRYVNNSFLYESLPQFPREAMVTSHPWLYQRTHENAHFLAEIDLSKTEPGMDTLPGEGDLRLWLRIIDVRKVKVIKIYPRYQGLMRAQTYHKQLPRHIIQLRRFYEDCWLQRDTIAA
jgi:hypothetical protein